MTLKKTFALRLKELRKSRNLTQEQLAELVDVAPRHISFIETARSFPSCDLIERICNVFKISYSELFAFKEKISREVLLDQLSETVKNLDDKKLNSLLHIARNL